MKYVELVGLVKFDFLGLKNLTVIQNAVKLIREGKDPLFDITLLKDDDQASYDLITAGNTTGIFQLAWRRCWSSSSRPASRTSSRRSRCIVPARSVPAWCRISSTASMACKRWSTICRNWKRS